MLDVGGQDATEAFEDVGHSDEARETLDKLYAGDLKRIVCCHGLCIRLLSCVESPMSIRSARRRARSRTKETLVLISCVDVYAARRSQPQETCTGRDGTCCPNTNCWPGNCLLHYPGRRRRCCLLCL